MKLKTFIALTASLVAVASAAVAAPAYAHARESVMYWGTAKASKGKADEVTTPTAQSHGDKVVQVATTNADWFALRSTGEVDEWGSQTSKPTNVHFPDGVKIAKLADSGSFDTMLAIDTTGQVWGWGRNSEGQLCLGNTNPYPDPAELPFSSVTAVAGAGDHALYLSDGTLYACGGNGNGDLGDDSTAPSAVPVVVPLRGVTAVFASFRNSGAIAGGTYYDWGFNEWGEIGNGTTTDAESPVAVSLPSPVTSVALGGSVPKNGQTIALAGGDEYAWGNDALGQLGDGRTTRVVDTPEQITMPAPLVAVESGGQSSYGIDTSGNLWGWGDDSSYELGNPAGGDQLTPSVILSGVAQVSATASAVDTLGTS